MAKEDLFYLSNNILTTLGVTNTITIDWQKSCITNYDDEGFMLTNSTTNSNPDIEKIKEWIRTINEIEKLRDKSRTLKRYCEILKEQLLIMLGEATMRD